MTGLRRRLRLWAAASLVMQSAWLFALMPLDCCAAHQPASAKPECHDEAPKPPDCHMEAAGAAACPMHQNAGHAGQSNPRCTMRASCNGPMTGLLSLLSAQGILPAAPALSAPVEARAATATLHEQLTRRFIPPDSPPPRA